MGSTTVIITRFENPIIRVASCESLGTFDETFDQTFTGLGCGPRNIVRVKPFSNLIVIVPRSEEGGPVTVDSTDITVDDTDITVDSE